MIAPTSGSMGRRLARRLGSPWTGAILIALIVAYLAAVSVLTETHPGLVRRLLRTPADRVYSHWLLIALAAALCLSLLVATATRIPLVPARAGAWCAHLGVIVLAVGAGRYVLGRVRGECLTRRTPTGWTDVDRFYLSRSAAAYVFERRDGQAHQTPLSIDPLAGGRQPQRVGVRLAGGPESVEIRAEQFLPHSRLVYESPGDDQGRMADERRGRPAEAQGPDDPFAGPLLGVELRAGPWRRTVWLAYADFLELTDPEWVQLPDGQTVGLAFSGPTRPLGGTLRVRGAEYLTYPGSIVPKDYRCDVSLLDDGRVREETLSLNHPVSLGAYQIGQGSWRPSAEAPMAIVFTVATRPGLPVVYVGMVMIAVALPYAFYVKPLLVKRRRPGS